MEQPCASLELKPGEAIGSRYRVVRRIGAGGMGAVFEVEHEALRQRCALKLLLEKLGSDDSVVKRFHREALAMASIHSAHVVRVTDFGRLENGLPFLVMELLYGEDLRRLLQREGRLPVARAVALALSACRGLMAVHDAGLVHRDVKPGNLFVTKGDSDEELCKLLDFGVVKSGEGTETKPNQLIGTMRYMAPEQLTNGKVDGRADIYALCATLYECIAGHPPHIADSLERVLFSVMNTEPAALIELGLGISPSLSRLVQRGLARTPGERFSSAHELAQELQRLSSSYIASATIGVPRDSLSHAVTLVPGRRRKRSHASFATIVASASGALVMLLTPPCSHGTGLPQKNGAWTDISAQIAAGSIHTARMSVVTSFEEAAAHGATEAASDPTTPCSAGTAGHYGSLERQERTGGPNRQSGRPAGATSAALAHEGAVQSPTPAVGQAPRRRSTSADELVLIGSGASLIPIDPRNPYGPSR